VFDIEDTLVAYDLFLDVRNNTNYAFSNLYVFLELSYQDQLVIRDTVELPISEASGKWTGRVSGTLVENHFLTYPQMVFSKSGSYKIVLHQAMMGPDWFCDDDAMTDYFHRSHYTDIRIGSWRQDYVFTGRTTDGMVNGVAEENYTFA
jgi:hypothetical protein